MKRLMLFCIIVLCLMPLFSCAEEGEDTLYPIRENGLWGYMNRAGETVIKPTWDLAEPFSEGFAVVGAGELPDRVYGLIDRNGTAVVPVQYAGIRDCGAFCLFGGEKYLWDGKIGWYDKNSGFCQAPVYDDADRYPTDSGLIRVSWWEGGERNKGICHTAYMDRASGETVIPFDYAGEPYTDGTFHEGFAFWLIENDDGFDGFLIDLTGSRVAFPVGYEPVGEVCEGVLRITGSGDEAFVSGLARPDGTVVFTLTDNEGYLSADASEGRVFFERDDNRVGMMDLEGNVILPTVLEYDPGWDFLGRKAELFFRNGYALIMLCDEDNSRSYVFVDREGRTVFRMARDPDPGIIMSPCTFAMENGLACYEKITLLPDGKTDTAYGLIRLSAQGGEYLTEPVFDCIPSHREGILEFSEGVLAVSRDGLWGYIDEAAEWVIPPQFDSADNFRDGLALVEKGGKLGYIDIDGMVVWEEAALDEAIPVRVGDSETTVQAILRGGAVGGEYALIPFAQVLEAMGYPLDWQDETLASVTIGDQRYVLDTAAGAFYRDTNEGNLFLLPPGTSGHPTIVNGTGMDFMVDSDSCELALLSFGWFDHLDLSVPCVQIVPRPADQAPAGS